jgi:YjbE family integral membrane protein
MTFDALSALVQVIIVDLVLAGDNAIIIAMVVTGFAPAERARLLMVGIVAATLVRIGFAVVTVQLMQVPGLMLVGGLLLFWVCWKLGVELAQHRATQQTAAAAMAGGGDVDGVHDAPAKPVKTMRQAVIQIVVADVSMSLDNVLAVAGVAREHQWVLVFGLVLSIAFMGLCATLIARLLNRHQWIAYIGLAIIFYVACVMSWEGVVDVSARLA